jgi:hypothetical protein
MLSACPSLAEKPSGGSSGSTVPLMSTSYAERIPGEEAPLGMNPYHGLTCSLLLVPRREVLLAVYG